MVIFPGAADDGCNPIRSIADQLGCNGDVVHKAFSGVSPPEWDTPLHLDSVKATAHVLNDAARHAANLTRTLRKLDEQERSDLLEAGCASLQQIEHLAYVLAGNERNLAYWLKERDRGGGRNPAAYAVGEGMRRVFRRLRRRITFGLSPSGDPSTDFCRAVEFGLGAFGVRADWRGPARAAIDRQAEIQCRLGHIAEASHSQRMRTQ